MTTAHVACLRLAPWPLVLLTRQHPGVPVAVLSEGKRVLHASPDAEALGVQPGMRETAALSRCPELHAVVVTAPVAQAAWNDLLEQLYARYSDRIEGREVGVAYLSIGPAAARELAAALHAPVGVASSLEVAQLAARRAKPGEVREVGSSAQAEKLFLSLTPIQDLQALGLSSVHVERLRFLGVRGLADLLKWSAAQREAFLGVNTAKRLSRFLKGERTAKPHRYVSGQVIESSLSFDAPLMEPGQAEAALGDLLPVLVEPLRGKTAAYLTVHADTLGGRLTATRKLKWPQGEQALGRVALLALEDTHALPLGIDALTVQFSGLQQPARMIGLWAGLADLEVMKTVLDRFPEALVRVRWLDPFAYCADAMYEWVDWTTGTVRATPMTPVKPPPPTPVQRREKAAQRMVAFFEGVDP